MTWQNVPICDPCWKVEEPNRIPMRIRDPLPERCYRCSELTESGIVVRRDVR
jgi:hypothetical protein